MKYILAAFVIFILIPFAIAGISMAPWVPTRKQDIKKLLEILNLQSGEKFLEIGCGDARVSIAVAQKFPSSHISGVELAYPVYFLAKIRKYFLGTDNFSLYLGNAFQEDFGKYDAIYVYGMPDKIGAKIIPKFLQEAKSGSKLYSYIFSIPKSYRKNSTSYGEKHEAKIHVLEKK